MDIPNKAYLQKQMTISDALPRPNMQKAHYFKYYVVKYDCILNVRMCLCAWVRVCVY